MPATQSHPNATATSKPKEQFTVLERSILHSEAWTTLSFPAMAAMPFIIEAFKAKNHVGQMTFNEDMDLEDFKPIRFTPATFQHVMPRTTFYSAMKEIEEHGLVDCVKTSNGQAHLYTLSNRWMTYTAKGSARKRAKQTDERCKIANREALKRRLLERINTKSVPGSDTVQEKSVPGSSTVGGKSVPGSGTVPLPYTIPTTNTKKMGGGGFASQSTGKINKREKQRQLYLNLKAKADRAKEKRENNLSQKTEVSTPELEKARIFIHKKTPEYSDYGYEIDKEAFVSCLLHGNSYKSVFHILKQLPEEIRRSKFDGIQDYLTGHCGDSTAYQAAFEVLENAFSFAAHFFDEQKSCSTEHRMITRICERCGMLASFEISKMAVLEKLAFQCEACTSTVSENGGMDPKASDKEIAQKICEGLRRRGEERTALKYIQEHGADTVVTHVRLMMRDGVETMRNPWGILNYRIEQNGVAQHV